MELRYRVGLARATEFQRRVWGVVAQIPYGETRSYSWVAEQVRSSPRAVGQALARNPYPLLIPCHRVVGKDGGLGGYTGGLALKRKLLELEREAVERLKASGGRGPG